MAIRGSGRRRPGARTDLAPDPARKPPVLERILPAGVAVATRRDDVLDASLFEREAEIVAGAVEKRRREFSTGRPARRDALGQLGVPPRAILPGPRGEPLWPTGVVGSITHCDGYRGGAVARRCRLAALGIDAEPHRRCPRAARRHRCARGAAGRWPRSRGQIPRSSWDRLLFSAKESVYKAWFPLAGRWLGFEDARVAIDRGGRPFTARLLVRALPSTVVEVSGFSGAWLIAGGGRAERNRGAGGFRGNPPRARF